MDKPWTAEPWTIRQGGVGRFEVVDAAGVVNARVPVKANAARIILCVNALEGMTEADIDTMVQRWKEQNQ